MKLKLHLAMSEWHTDSFSETSRLGQVLLGGPKTGSVLSLLCDVGQMLCASLCTAVLPDLHLLTTQAACED